MSDPLTSSYAVALNRLAQNAVKRDARIKELYYEAEAAKDINLINHRFQDYTIKKACC
jgi:hypothetical protein